MNERCPLAPEARALALLCIIVSSCAATGPSQIDAAEGGDAAAAEALAKDFEAGNAVADSLNGALIDAAGEGNAAAARLLLNAGADANARDDDGATALMAAASGGHADAVNALLDAGAR